jgi:hypothetical protein
LKWSGENAADNRSVAQPDLFPQLAPLVGLDLGDRLRMAAQHHDQLSEQILVAIHGDTPVARLTHDRRLQLRPAEVAALV